MIKKSPRNKEFFKNYKLNCKKKINLINIESLIKKDNKLSNKIINIIKKCLIIDPNLRINIHELISLCDF
jgi:serine/threonine protein kinase